MLAVSVNTRRRIAQWLQRASWLVGMMRFAFHMLQPRFTAGVVGVVLNSRGEVLLVEHVFHPRAPWGLPGGWLERGETPIQGLQRELREEMGIQVSVSRPLLVETGYYYQSHLDIAFLCQAESEVSSLSSELLDYRWTNLEDLPEMLPFHHAAVLVATSQRKIEV